MIPQNKKTQKNLQFSCFAFLICFAFFCFASGCAHGTKKSTQKATIDEKNIDSGFQKTETVQSGSIPDDEEDDFFDDEDDDSELITKEKKLVADPLYYFNIAMFHLNDKLYFWCIKPVAKAYKAVTPGFFRTGVRNFFSNVSTPARFTSSLLQGKIKGAGAELGSFVINTTLGFGGIIDTAKNSFHISKSNEDLGQVLGKYGIGNGFYLYLPFYGPTTLRDAAGSAASAWYLSPVRYMENRRLATGLTALDSINSVSFMIGNYESVKAASLDPYAMVRDFYIEQRKKKIKE